MTTGDDMAVLLWIKSKECDDVYVYDFSNTFLYFINNKARVYVGAGSWSDDTITDICDNTWHHLSIIHDESITNTKIYIDGIEEVDSTTGNLTMAGDLEIGARSADNWFNGQIDDVKIYNYARTQAQIAWDYNKGAPIGWWGFDEATSGSADGVSLIDFSGNGNNGTGDDGGNNAGLSWGSGKVNSALDFDGTDDYVDVGDISYNINTISFWLKADSLTEDIIDLDGGTHTVQISGGNASSTGFVSPSVYVDGIEKTALDTDWHHILIMTDTVIDANDFDIGRIGTSYFDGKIDEVKVWNYVLTNDMVKEEFSGGVVRFGDVQ